MGLSLNLDLFEKQIDNEMGTIMFYRRGFQGIPDKVLHGDGFTVEIQKNEVVIIDVHNPNLVMSKVVTDAFEKQAA